MLTPIRGEWYVQVQHGKDWRAYWAPVLAFTDLGAARIVRKAWGKYRRIRVRPVWDPGARWRVYRFAA